MPDIPSYVQASEYGQYNVIYPSASVIANVQVEVTHMSLATGPKYYRGGEQNVKPYVIDVAAAKSLGLEIPVIWF